MIIGLLSLIPDGNGHEFAGRGDMIFYCKRPPACVGARKVGSELYLGDDQAGHAATLEHRLLGRPVTSP